MTAGENNEWLGNNGATMYNNNKADLFGFSKHPVSIPINYTCMLPKLKIISFGHHGRCGASRWLPTLTGKKIHKQGETILKGQQKKKT